MPTPGPEPTDAEPPGVEPPGAEPATARLVARLFAAHHAPLYRYLVRLTGDPDRAADAAQEAFVRALTSDTLPAAAVLAGALSGDAAGETFGTSDDPRRAWLFRVATRVALDDARTTRRRQRLADAAPGRMPLADAPADPHAVIEAQERHARVAAALAALPVRDRTALLLREAGFAHREIARALGTTTGSIGTVLARALPRFAAALRAAVPGAEEAL